MPEIDHPLTPGRTGGVQENPTLREALSQRAFELEEEARTLLNQSVQEHRDGHDEIGRAKSTHASCKEFAAREINQLLKGRYSDDLS